jgi:hypothetical protein
VKRPAGLTSGGATRRPSTAGRRVTQPVRHEHSHTTTPAPVVESIKIERGQRGGCGWTIEAASIERALELDRELLAKLKSEGKGDE